MQGNDYWPGNQKSLSGLALKDLFPVYTNTNFPILIFFKFFAGIRSIVIELMPIYLQQNMYYLRIIVVLESD